MRFFTTLTAIIALATLSIGAPLTSRDVINDITEARQVVANLRGHLGGSGFNVIALANDDLAMTTILDRITKDASDVNAFNEADATEIISRTSQLASEVETTTAALIAKKDSVQGIFRNAVAQGLQVIINHAKAAGDAVVKDCPADKKAEANRVYLRIANSLSQAEKTFAS
ncbi:hypothetical protein AGABI2DRAFT_194710 [Agaricus bisporus var. bisporus H97]|uniref:hypothetical protein n=1 Tax=Agaricus bisporus var. bisporus (strain H97 / ATCC MYA-4626 / FGSC 10389) TaxID=936046 RepID=UPI00029F52D6|nr:hypothetical protein AGABI2DRAFT_194710 [Agaricus bisporus var. bisporus H97]EKV44830.1 hypothetical protein AGABI2DRAFT_194710 [Agaricus bisporus var. bisporus H97]